MSSKVKVSVIVPIHNSQTTIRECLDSLIRQTMFDSMEIIIVDDASTDSGITDASEYEMLYPDKVAIVKLDETGGEGNARNIGLSYAKGEYVGFIDPEDAAAEYMYEEMYKKALSEAADYVDSGIFDIRSNKAVAFIPQELAGELDTNKRKELIAGGSGYYFSKIFRNVFLKKNNILFDTSDIPDCIDFLVECNIKAERISTIQKTCYIRRNQLTERDREKKDPVAFAQNKLFAIDSIYARVKTSRIYPLVKDAFETLLLKLYSEVLDICAYLLYEKSLSEDEIKLILNTSKEIKNTFCGDVDYTHWENSTYVDVNNIRANDISSEAFIENVRNTLKKKYLHFYNNDKPFTTDRETILMTISIPTYNRGELALSLVTYLIDERKKHGLEGCVEILVSDNGSIKGQSEYESISKLADREENLIYFRFDENRFFAGNMENVLKRARGRWCLILSDEDRVDFEGLEAYLAYLITHPEISVMKGLTSGQYRDIKGRYAKAGSDAIDEFYLRGNYISGIIYNKQVLTEKIVDHMILKYKKNNRAYYHYPHLFYDAYCLLNGAFASSDVKLVDEGEPAYVENKQGVYLYSTAEERISQGIGYLEQIREITSDEEIKCKMFLMAYMKTKSLIDMVKDKLVAAGMDYEETITEINDSFLSKTDSMNFDNAAFVSAIKNFIEGYNE